jgi:hypothetical protein
LKKNMNDRKFMKILYSAATEIDEENMIETEEVDYIQLIDTDQIKQDFEKKLTERQKKIAVSIRKRIIAVTVVAAALLFVVSLPPVRAFFYKIMTQVYDQSVVVGILSGGEHSEDSIPISFGYIPEGFVISEEGNENGHRYVLLKKGEEYIMIVKLNYKEREHTLYGEYPTREEITIRNGISAILFSDGSKIALYFVDDYEYTIVGLYASQTEILKIAENIS